MRQPRPSTILVWISCIIAGLATGAWAQPEGRSLSFSYTPLYQFETDLDSAGSFDVQRHLVRFGWMGSVTERLRMGLGLSYDFEKWSFSDLSRIAGATPWDTIHRPGISRMTLTLREDSDDKMLQVIRQVEKMTEVISARELDIEQSFWREVAIVKFEADGDQFERLRRNHNFEVLDRQNHGLFIVQVGGTSQMIDDFVDAIGSDKIVEVARSGFTALEK